MRGLTVTLVAAIAACNQPMQPRADAAPVLLADARTAQYEVVDLGPFFARGINSRGAVTGQVFVGNDLHALVWDNGEAQDLGTLRDEPPGFAVFPVAMNQRGQIVGSNSYGFDHVRGFLWDHGVMQDLGDLLGGQNDGPQVIANAISSSGHVVGQSQAGFGRHAFLWRDGTMTDLGTLGGFRSSGIGVNAKDQVVGWSLVANSQTQHAFLWQDGTMQDLGTLGGDETVALLINEAGQVAGMGTTASGEVHAFAWSGGALQDIGAFTPVAIDEAGRVAGNGGGSAFVWDDGVLTPLGSLGGRTTVTGMNNAGLIVGTSRLASGEDHAFLWGHGEMTDLGALADGAASSAVAISDCGTVAGTVRLASGETRATEWRKGGGPTQAVVASR